MNKKIISVLLILIVAGVGYYFFNMKAPNLDKDDYNRAQEMSNSTSTQTQSDSSNTSVPATPKVSTTTTAPAPTTTPAPSVSKTYTLTDIASHSSKDSCWSAIGGKVYDLTSWIGKHPGGDGAILSICGKDGSQLFDGKHGMDGRAKGVLPNFYLGDLAN